jgi:hypothetical protein
MATFHLCPLRRGSVTLCQQCGLCPACQSIELTTWFDRPVCPDCRDLLSSEYKERRRHNREEIP